MGAQKEPLQKDEQKSKQMEEKIQEQIRAQQQAQREHQMRQKQQDGAMPQGMEHLGQMLAQQRQDKEWMQAATSKGALPPPPQSSSSRGNRPKPSASDRQG